MIDISNEVFQALSTTLRGMYGNSFMVMAENTNQPAAFPCVAVDEIYKTISE